MSTQFDAIGIAVSDMAESLSFYRLLGLSIPSDAAEEGHVETTTSGGVRIMFDTEAVMAGFDPGWSPPRDRGRIGLAFRCEDADGVDRTFRTVVTAGHRAHLEPFDAPWGQRYASVLDPDGNVIDLFA